MALDRSNPSVVGQVQVVENLAGNRRLDKLQVHNPVSQRVTKELVGHRNRANRAERDVVNLLVLKDCLPCVDNPTKLCNPVPVKVHLDIALKYLDVLHRWVLRLLV